MAFVATARTIRKRVVDPEEALNNTTEKFVRRFEFVENGATEAGKKVEEMTLEQLDELWEQSKSKGL